MVPISMSQKPPVPAFLGFRLHIPDLNYSSLSTFLRYLYISNLIIKTNWKEARGTAYLILAVLRSTDPSFTLLHSTDCTHFSQRESSTFFAYYTPHLLWLSFNLEITRPEHSRIYALSFAHGRKSAKEVPICVLLWNHQSFSFGLVLR